MREQTLWGLKGSAQPSTRRLSSAKKPSPQAVEGVSGTPDPSVSAHVHHGAQTGTSHARMQPRAVFGGVGALCAPPVLATPCAGLAVVLGARVSPRVLQAAPASLRFQLASVLI